MGHQLVTLLLTKQPSQRLSKFLSTAEDVMLCLQSFKLVLVFYQFCFAAFMTTINHEIPDHWLSKIRAVSVTTLTFHALAIQLHPVLNQTILFVCSDNLPEFSVPSGKTKIA